MTDQNVSLNSLNPLPKDIIVSHVDMNEVNGSLIQVKENSDSDTTQFYRVHRIGRDVTMVSEGDLIVIPWRRITPPFVVDYDGKELRVGITAETEVLGVIDAE